MKIKTRYLMLVLAALLILGGFLFYKNISNGESIKDKDEGTVVPSNFNIIYTYGPFGKNSLDTFENLIAKDMVMNPPAKMEFILSQNDREIIRQKIKELDLYKIEPLVYGTENLCNLGAPPGQYYLKIEDNGVIWEKYWHDCEKEINKSYADFSSFMESLIESKEEFKKMPAPRGGYQ